MKPLALIALALSACAHVQNSAVTAPARSSVAAAQTATGEARAASERSSGHIKAVRGNLSTIDFKATRALKLLDSP